MSAVLERAVCRNCDGTVYLRGRCRACYEWRRRHGDERPARARIRAEPLIGLVRRSEHNVREIAQLYSDRHGARQESVERRLVRLLAGESPYVDVGFADALCIALGLHPVQVYGEEWWA